MTLLKSAMRGAAGRSTSTTPLWGGRDMDVSFIKNIPIHERYDVQFRWEMFNATNTPSYGSPDSNPTDSNFGQIGNIGPIQPRVIQGALKVTL